MTRTEGILVVAFGAVFLLWLGIALYLVITRAIYDVQAALVRSARQVAERPLRSALERNAAAEELEQALGRLRWKTVYRLASDTSTPRELRATLARNLLARQPAKILSSAGAHRSEVDRWKRTAALRIVAEAGWPQAMPLLVRALADDDREIVGAAVAILGSLETDAAAVALIAALRDDRYSASRIASQIDHMALSSPQPLLGLLDDLDPQLRFWGATLLSRYADGTKVAAALVARTGDPDPSVRAAAVESLAGTQRSPGTAAAIALLEDPVWFVRAHAARALGKIGGESAKLVAPLLADREWWVRAAAKDALTAGGAETVRPVLAYLDHPDRFARNGAAELLQQSGLLDELIAAAAEDPSDELKRQVVRKIFGAGSGRLARALLERSDERTEPFVRELVEERRASAS